MKRIKKIKYYIIPLVIIIFIGCDKDDATTETIIPFSEISVYFTSESVEVDRLRSEPFTVELRYEGPKINLPIEIPYTVSYPNENSAIEGEDFKLSKSRSFIIDKGEAITKVVLLQQVINNENATENRSLRFELQTTNGITIGNSSSEGNLITVTIPPFKPIDPNDPEDFIGDKKFTLSEGGSTFKIPYFSNREDIRDTSNSNIARAIIALHGSSHTAGNHYNNMLGAANLESANLESILIVAPQFVGEEEIDEFSLDEEHLYWSGTGWRIGFTSLDEDSNPREEQISSFTVMDSLITKLSEYPNLEKIVFTGHSAGGQFIARYSASTPIVENLNSKGIDISFVVNNPGTYTYLNNKRKVLGTENTFAVPSASAIESCPEYNEYRFGLDDLPFYLREIGGADVYRDRLQQRKVTYLIGQNDNDTSEEATSINSLCEAILQGNDRFERALNYFDHLQDFYGTSILENQKLQIVPGVGHSSQEMYQSDIGRENTFRN